MGRRSVLAVDDEQAILWVIRETLGPEGYDVDTAKGGQEAIDKIASRFYDLVITDLMMPDRSGMDVIEAAKSAWPETEILVITAYPSIETAIQAMKRGAADYLTKPLEPEEILLQAERILSSREPGVEKPVVGPAAPGRYDGIIGTSAPMQAVFRLVDKVAPVHCTVLIQGESGTGKELVARAIHANSGRRDKPFLPVHCGGLVETLLDSELFGHVKGAFTGAVSEKKGAFELANGGTLFLDEINSISEAMQVKLLRVLQDQSYAKVGDPAPRKADVRVLAAGSADMSERVAAGAFRTDLYYRLNTVTIQLPPLRERTDDIPLLVDHFLGRLSETLGCPVRRLTPQAMERLLCHRWPGNVRELEHVLQRAMILAEGDVIDPSHLPAVIAGEDAPGAPSAFSLEEAEKRHIQSVLHFTQGRRQEAARLLGVDTSTLWRKMKKYGLLSIAFLQCS